MEKLSLENMMNVYEALLYAFHDDPSVADDVNPKFIEVWDHFMTASGWSEEEFWHSYDEAILDGECGECGECDECGCDDCIAARSGCCDEELN